MFGALNRFISRLDADTGPQGTNQGPGDNSFGFQVLRNTNPDLPIEPWFDFIIGINSHYIVRPQKTKDNMAVTDLLAGLVRPKSLCNRSAQLRRFLPFSGSVEREGMPAMISFVI